jgi:hypothetical protein
MKVGLENQSDDDDSECFRKYYEPAESFNDHALFLTGRSRYASLFNLSKRIRVGKWSQKSGLRHRPQISEKLISYIERYDLGRYDAIVMGKTILHLKSKTQESLLLTVRIDPYMRCKRILCIPYQKNITCWLMS